MKALKLFLLLLFPLSLSAQKIIDLPTATDISGAYIAITQGGVTKKAASNLFGSTYIPTLTGNSGKVLTNDGSNLSWLSITANSLLPSQTGNAGKLLKTDGSNISWINAVTSFNSRTGSVTPQSGDYSISQITNGLSNSLNAGHLFVGNGSNLASDVALSGDGTLSSLGVLSVTKILGNTIPANAPGLLTNNGSGGLSWSSFSFVKTDGSLPLTADWNVGGYKITNLVDPSSSQDAATKAYVDAVAQGLAIKTSARLATTDTLPSNSYYNGTSGVGATLTANRNGTLTIDGVTPSLNDRILVKDEATYANNGIYTVTTLGDVGTPYVLTRTTDCDQNSEIPSAFVFVSDGIVNVASGWVVIGSSFTVGSSDILWTQFNGINITAGTGLTLSGTTLNVNTTQNITQLSNLTTKGLVLTDASGNLSSNHAAGFVRSDALGNIIFDNSTYLTTESDPVYLASSWYSTTNNSTNWNTAYNKRLSSASFSTSLLTLTFADATSITSAIPTWNQTTTGGSAYLTTPRNINGVAFDGTANISINLNNALTVDNSSLQLNSGTTFDGSAGRTISVKAGGITNSMLTNSAITIAGNSTSLGGSVTVDQITGLSSTGLVKRTAANTLGIATAGVDYLSSESDPLAYKLASGGTATAANTFTFNSLGWLTINGTATTTANNQIWFAKTPSLTMRATASDVLTVNQIANTVTLGSTTQNPIGLDLSNTYVQTGGISSTLASTSTVAGMTATTYTNIAPASTSGSGTGALFTVVVGSATSITSVTPTTAGSGYKVNETITFNGSQFGSGSGSAIFTIRTVTGVSLGTSATPLSVGVRGVNGADAPKLIDFLYEGTSVGSLRTIGANGLRWYDAAGNETFRSTPAAMVISASTLLISGTATFAASPTFQLPVTSSATNAINATPTSVFNATGQMGDLIISNAFQSKYKTTVTSVPVGHVTGVSILSGGTGYTTGSKPTTGGSGTNCSITVGSVSGGVVTSVSVAISTASGLNYKVGDVLTLTTGGGNATVTVTAVDLAGTLQMFDDGNTITDASSNNKYISFGARPTYNITSTQTGTLAALYYNPTLTSTGSFINGGVIIAPSSCVNGFGTTSPTASVHIVGSGSTVTFKAVGAGTGTNPTFRLLQSDGTTINAEGLDNGNFAFFGAGSYGSGTKVIFIGNGTAPSGTPSGGGILYVESGALKFKGSSGTVTTIANP